MLNILIHHQDNDLLDMFHIFYQYMFNNLNIYHYIINIVLSSKNIFICIYTFHYLVLELDQNYHLYYKHHTPLMMYSLNSLEFFHYMSNILEYRHHLNNDLVCIYIFLVLMYYCQNLYSNHIMYIVFQLYIYHIL
jgi:hypothetical protein